MAPDTPADELRLENFPDDSVDDATDRELRVLLSTCFTKPGDDVFLKRRYHLEPPEHRWVVRAASGSVIAHAALRWRVIEISGIDRVIAGLSEVCVAPVHRGQGLVARLLEPIHAWVREHRCDHALLFGDRKVYGSSGYIPARNVFRYWHPHKFRWTEERLPSALVRGLSSRPWPEGRVDLRGVVF